MNSDGQFQPGSIIGYRKDGRPIRLIAGGAPEDEGQTDGGQGEGQGESTEPQTEPTGEPSSDSGDEGDPNALGDPGKRALDAMKAKWQTERDKRRGLEQRIAELERANAPKPEGDVAPDVDAITRDAEAKATQAANKRIVKAEVKAAAAGKLADPADALTMIDLSEFEVDSDGNVDADEIASAIDELLQKKPYLSAQSVRRFQGGADGGARKTNREGAQLSRADLKGMTPQQIVKAQNEGQLNDLLGIKSR